MWCIKCNHDLAECECPDLKERMAKIQCSNHILMAPEYLKRIQRRADQNENEQARQE